MASSSPDIHRDPSSTPPSLQVLPPPGDSSVSLGFQRLYSSFSPSAEPPPTMVPIPLDPYGSPGAAYDLKEGFEAWRSLSYPPSFYYPYEAAGPLGGYPFPNGYAGLDVNGSRRKNATRETTSTLKAWLNEHRKNPYPTKGEKIMLAIITKMTLTQVSTWFANARRRLKKENKMTWEPRNRSEDEDGGVGDSDEEVLSPGEQRLHPLLPEVPKREIRKSSSEEGNFGKEPKQPAPSRSPESVPSSPSPVQSKPRIWSLVDTATSSNPVPAREDSHIPSAPHPHLSYLYKHWYSFGYPLGLPSFPHLPSPPLDFQSPHHRTASVLDSSHQGVPA